MEVLFQVSESRNWEEDEVNPDVKTQFFGFFPQHVHTAKHSSINSLVVDLKSLKK